MVFAAFLVVTTAVGFLLDPRLMSDLRFASNHIFANIYLPHRVSNLILFSDIFVAIPAFVLGPFLLNESLRNKYLKLHRAGGMIYAFGAVGCGVSGFILGLCNTQGIMAKLGFATLGALLVLTTVTSVRAAIRKKFVQHRVWAIRSYALMFAFFFVKFLFIAYGLYFKGRIDPDLYKQILSWACWVPNLMMAEIYISMTTPTGKFVGWKNIIGNYAKNRILQGRPGI